MTIKQQGGIFGRNPDFNSVEANSVDAGSATINGELNIADKISHKENVNTSIRFPSDNTVTIETAGSEAVRVNDNGYFGVQTSNPLGPLHVEGGPVYTPYRRLEARALNVSDTVNWTNVLTVGNRATYHILICGSDAGGSGAGFGIVETWAVCSNDIKQGVTPNEIYNNILSGIDVQWSGGTLQVKARLASSNQWVIKVETLSQYYLGSQPDITWII